MIPATNNATLPSVAQTPAASNAQKAPGSSCLSLAMDPLRHILRFLPLKTWAGAARTCRQWNSAVDLSCTRFREASGQREEMTDAQRAEAMRVCVLMHRKELGVSGEMLTDFFDPMNFEASTEPLLGNESGAISNGRLHRLTRLMPQLASPFFTSLKTLRDVTWPQNRFDRDVWVNSMPKHQLESLELIGPNLNASENQAVRVLIRTYGNQYKQINEFPKLRTLIIRSNSFQTQSLMGLANFNHDLICLCPGLTRLELHMKTWKGVDRELTYLSEYVPLLKELRIDLTHMKKVDAGFLETLQCLPHYITEMHEVHEVNAGFIETLQCLPSYLENLTLLETGNAAVDQAILLAEGNAELMASRKAKQNQTQFEAR